MTRKPIQRLQRLELLQQDDPFSLFLSDSNIFFSPRTHNVNDLIGCNAIFRHVIFQFPLYWYSYPPLLKKWFDDVLAYGWAYGSNGDKLNGKKLGLAISIGDKKENYQPEGSVSFTVDEVIAPFKASAKHVGAEALPYFAVFGASFQASDEKINTSAKEYINYIFKYHI